MSATSDLAVPRFETLEQLVDACVAFYERNREELQCDRVRKRRDDLAGFVETFHRDCGTLTSGVQEALETLRTGHCVVVMSAHQPNLFAYSGVMRKTTLIFVLAKALEARLNVPVVNFFGVADQDFTDDRWLGTSLLPAVQRRDGVLPIHLKLAEKVVLNRVPKPSRDLIDSWRTEIRGWLETACNSVDRLQKICSEPMLDDAKGILEANLEVFWRLVEGCYDRATSYADLNAFVMSQIVNAAWGYDTLFARFSECQQAFADEIAFLLSRYEAYSRSLAEAHAQLAAQGISSGVSAEESQVIPFWYHCECGSKVRLESSLTDGMISGRGDCLECGRTVELDLGSVKVPAVAEVAAHLSLRAISWILTFSKGLGFSCYVGGVGGLWYLMEVRHAADELGILMPPTPVWRPHDRYLGIGQLEAWLEMKRICASFEADDLSSAKDVLGVRIADARRCLGKLEASREQIMARLREDPADANLRLKVKRVSLSQTEVKRTASLSVLVRELKVLENVPVVLNLIPSIIDYAVNVGLKETSDQWIHHLTEDGRLSSEVHLESVLDHGEASQERWSLVR